MASLPCPVDSSVVVCHGEDFCLMASSDIRWEHGIFHTIQKKEEIRHCVLPVVVAECWCWIL